MPTVIAAPSVIKAAGEPPKRIEEYAGRVNSGHSAETVEQVVEEGDLRLAAGIG